MLAANGPLYSVLFWAIGAPDLAFYVFLATVVVGTTPLVFRLSRSPGAAANQSMLGLWGVLVSVGAFTDGVESPALMWYTLMPAFGMLLSGSRLAVAWTAVAVVTGMGFAGAEMAGVRFESVLTPGYELVYWLATPATIIPLHLGLVAIFYAARQRMLVEVEQAQGALAVALEHSTTVLDTVDEGLLLLDPKGELLAAPSKAALGWFGPPQAGETAWGWLERIDADASTRLLLGWEELSDAIMPIELLLMQMEVDVHFQGREYTTRTKIIDLAEDDSWSRALLVIKDVTEERAARRADAANQELIALLMHLGRDRSGLMAFFDDLQVLVEQAAAPGLRPAEAFRVVHTIKGNAGLFGINSLVRHCHELESSLRDEGRALTTDEARALQELHRGLMVRVGPILDRRGMRPIPDSELTSLARAISEGADHACLAGMVKRWRWESIEKRFVRMERQARALAERLGKGEIEVVLQHGDLFEAPDAFTRFWSSIAHVIRNAIDHGLETPEARAAAGKGIPTVRFSAEIVAYEVRITISDDGQGIAWERLRDKAARAGLPHSSPAELEDALFADNISTSETVSEVSGRGVGMAAVKAAVVALGGRIEIDSSPGAGTTFRFAFPARERCEVLTVPEGAAGAYQASA